jgi:large subunit ribosomal protein L25
MSSKATKLSISERAISNSRETRRLRRSGQVPGILYGGTEEPFAFSVDERELRHALAASGAVLDLELGGQTTSAVLKDSQHNVVRGDTLHVDFLRVRLDVAIHAVVPLELVGGDDAPGVTEGGVLEHVLREVNIEALPNEIPERLEADVSAMNINDTVFLSSVKAPDGVTILDDLEENTVATLSPPKLEAELEALDAELEEETERVGEDGEPVEGEDAEAEGDGDSAEASGGDDSSASDDE